MRNVLFYVILIMIILLGQLATGLVLQFYPETIHTIRYFSQIPMGLAWVIATTVLILLIKRVGLSYGVSVIIGGFLSNVITFGLRGHFIDYVPTGISFINVEDLSILVGIVMLYFNSKKVAYIRVKKGF